MKAISSWFSVFINFVFLSMFGFASTSQDAGECNWHGKPESQAYQTGVSLVTLRCSHGYIDWQNPKGGAQIEFKQHIDRIGFEFIVKILSLYPGVNIYKDKNARGLQLLRASQNTNPKSPLFIQSKNGSATLYLDVPAESKNQVKILYELKDNLKTNWKKECKLCSSTKMAALFCNGDFAVKAKIENKYLHDDEKNVYLGLLVYHVFHQSSNIFLHGHHGKHYIGHVTMPSKCAPKTGKGHYILLGHIQKKFGPFVECHMKFGLWRTVQKYIKCDKKRQN